jgi:hypothetical protein
MQILLMDASERAQIGPECRAGAFAGITVHLASAVVIIIPRPLPHAMVHRGMGGMAASIALPLVGVQDRPPMGTFSAMSAEQVRGLA